MNEAMVPCDPLCYQPGSVNRTMNGNSEQHKSGERIAKVIARAGLASRRERTSWKASTPARSAALTTSASTRSGAALEGVWALWALSIPVAVLIALSVVTRGEPE